MKQGVAFKVSLDTKAVTELLQPAIDDSRDSDYIFSAARRGSSGHISPVNISQYFKQVVDELGISGALHSWRPS